MQTLLQSPKRLQKPERKTTSMRMLAKKMMASANKKKMMDLERFSSMRAIREAVWMSGVAKSKPALPITSK